MILPSIIFSIIYFLLFYEYKGLGNAVYSIINGCGHMWYLPMLFWCFVFGWLLEQIKIKDGWKMAFLVALNLLNVISLPLRISTAFTYLVYFYGGYLVYKHSERINSFITLRNIVISWIIFIVVFAVLRPLPDIPIIVSSCSSGMRAMIVIGNHAGQLIYASIGLIAFYVTAVYFTQHHQLSASTNKIAACCFGIYLFQQFVLQLLYYKNQFSIVGWALLVALVWVCDCWRCFVYAFSFVVKNKDREKLDWINCNNSIKHVDY